MSRVHSLLAPSFLVFLALIGAGLHAQTQTGDPTDKYIWLEDVNSPRAMDWVNAENARTAKVFEADPRFAAFQAEALKVTEDPNRLPTPILRGDLVYNFWNDEKNVRGLLRRTTVADYANPTPHWQTVLDIDALGELDGGTLGGKFAIKLLQRPAHRQRLGQAGSDARGAAGDQCPAALQVKCHAPPPTSVFHAVGRHLMQPVASTTIDTLLMLRHRPFTSS